MSLKQEGPGRISKAYFKAGLYQGTTLGRADKMQ